MKYLAIAFMLILAGYANAQKASDVHSPYERYLPQAPPSETNRVEFPAGYSIVIPDGWTTQVIPIEDWFKSSVADQIEIEGHVTDQYPPRITIQHMGPDEYALYHGMLNSTQSLSNGLTRITFQGQPAISRFLPGYGSRLAKGPWFDREYEPFLTRELFFERNGNGFILNFGMRNADKGKPYYTHPVPIIEQYLGTFRFKKPGK
jgi:hypothetical protein